jgi:isoleucyl-tRNA synthetase
LILNGGGNSYGVQPGHVTFIEELPAGIFQAPMTGGIVYVDVALTDDLEAEGYAREVIRRIQEMRRLRNLNVEDYIIAGTIIDDERVASLLQGHWRDEIMEEVRAGQFILSAGSSFPAPCSWELEKDWDVEGIPVLIGISKLAYQPGKK